MSQNLRPSQHQNTYASGAFSWNLGDFGLDAVFSVLFTPALGFAAALCLELAFEVAFLTITHPQLFVTKERLHGENAALRLKFLRRHINHIIILMKWR
jgi:hypothetical protein